jgi:DnaJ family protein C protein 9
MAYIPHSTIDDEPRFIIAITKLIDEGELPKMKEWERSIQDEKARLVRKKESEKEAKEAEVLAKELGVWDEFYGDGKPGKQKSRGKGKEKGAAGEEEVDDIAALQAVILKKKERTTQAIDSFFDSLEAKYAGGKKSVKGKKRDHAKLVGEDDEPSMKKVRQEIPEEEFAMVREKLFGPIRKISPPPSSKSKSTKKKSPRTQVTTK